MEAVTEKLSELGPKSAIHWLADPESVLTFFKLAFIMLFVIDASPIRNSPLPHTPRSKTTPRSGSPLAALSQPTLAIPPTFAFQSGCLSFCGCDARACEPMLARWRGTGDKTELLVLNLGVLMQQRRLTSYYRRPRAS
jgi:hypothetical protein